MSEEYEMDDYDAAYFLGAKILEMADRLKVANAVVPGSVATYKFVADEVPFTITLSSPKAAA